MSQYTQAEIQSILELHSKWLYNDKDGKKANLRGADLYGADLCGANLYGTDLCGANLYGTDLRGANLRGANLRGADLCGANLYGADLRGADLCGADLYGAHNIPYIPCACPEEGDFVGWKKAFVLDSSEAVIVKLRIPKGAKRSSATGRKCRAEKAKVLAFYNLDGTEWKDVSKVVSIYDKSFVYKIGKMVLAENYQEDRWQECAKGIHFFLNRREAVEFEM
jgi:hypothetical protein